jgi:hypothetical protein
VRSGSWVALVAAALVGLTPVPPAMADGSSTEGFLTIVGTGAVYQEQAAVLFRTPTDVATISGTGAQVAVQIGAGKVTLAAPPGELLHTGSYSDTVGVTEPRHGHPSLSVEWRYSGCYQVTGRFEVRQILLDEAGQVTGLDASFEERCGAGSVSRLGQVRVGLPLQDVESLPRQATFAPTEPTPAVATPVTLVNDSAAVITVGAPSVSGPEADDFDLGISTCGATLAAGASCQVEVAYAPARPGASIAAVSFTTSVGTRTTELSGHELTGTTAWSMVSEPGEHIGQGQTWSVPAAGQTLAINENQNVLRIDERDGTSHWNAAFSAGVDKPLTVGTYVAAGPPNYTLGPAMDVSRGNCGKTRGLFTVSELERQDGRIVRLDLTFREHCNDDAKELRGAISYRATDPAVVPDQDTTPPAAVGFLFRSRGLDSNVVLTWTLPDDVDLDHVIVRAKMGTTPITSPTDGTDLGAATGNTAVVQVVPGRDYAFAVFPVDISGNVGVGDPLLLAGTQLTLTPPAAIAYLGTAHLRGKLALASTGKPGSGLVVVYQRIAGTRQWSFTATAPVGYDGAIDVSVTPTLNVEYFFRYLGDGKTFGSSSSVVTVKAAPKVMLSSSAPTVKRGQRSTMVVHTYPATAHAACTLERLVGRTWTRVGGATTNRNGDCAFVLANGTRGNYTWRARTAATSVHAAGVSNLLTTRVT